MLEVEGREPNADLEVVAVPAARAAMRRSTVARPVARYAVSGTTPIGLRNCRYSSRM